MKRTIFLLMSALCFGCSGGRNGDEGAKIVFRKENAIRISDTELFRNKTVIPLETTDNSLVGDRPRLLTDGENFFVVNSNYENSVQQILRFDAKGKFLNAVGSRGNGPAEYADIYDVFIDSKDECVEVLTGGRIQKYDYGGTYLGHLDVNIAASFARTGSGYWLYRGSGNGESPYRLLRTDDSCRVVREYLTDGSKMPPVTAVTFGNGEYTTFWEPLYNNIYRITDDSLELAFTVEFPGLQFPSEVHQMDIDAVVKYLQHAGFATVYRYMENKTHLYLMIRENRGGEPSLSYHWIIDKQSGRETVILPDRTVDSYLLNPPLLARDGKLYFIGYPVESADEEIEDPDLNPSVVIIDLSGI
jgi:hypothetical protein